MAKTARFGFETFGGPDGGSITDDGSQFSHADRIALDHILQAFEEHAHKGGDKCPDPTEPPALALHATGGLLRPGKTYFYRCSFIDQYGLESAASDEVSATTPPALSPPNQPVLVTQAGGTLPLGVHSYGLTILDSTAQETRLGPLGLVTTTTGNQKVQLTLPDLGAGQSFNVWRLNPNATTYVQVATGVTAATLVDDGTLTTSDPDDPTPEADPSNQPPTSNLTASTNSIGITVSDAQLVATDGGPIKRWRVYRTTQSGTYAPSSLVAEVATTLNPDGTGGLITTIVDTGANASAGKPLDISQCLKPSIKITSGSSLGGGAFVMQSTSTAPAGGPSTRNWRLVASPDGALITLLALGVAPPPPNAPRSDYYLISNDGTKYKFTVDDNGDLHTDVGNPADVDVVFPAGQGPIISTNQAFVEYVLGVTNDGALTTTALNVGYDVPQFDSNGQPIRNQGPLVPASPVFRLRATEGSKGAYILWDLDASTWDDVITLDAPDNWYDLNLPTYNINLRDKTANHNDGIIDIFYPLSDGIVHGSTGFTPSSNSYAYASIQPSQAGIALEVICKLPDGPGSMGSNGRIATTSQVDFYPNQAGFELFWDDATGRLTFVMSDGMGNNNPNVYAVSGEFIPNAFNHIVAVWDQAVMYLYINGRLVRTTPFVSHQFSSTSTPSVLSYYNSGDMWIARNPNGDFDHFLGAIEQVLYYKKALTADQIATHYQAI